MITEEKYGTGDYNMENYWFSKGVMDNQRTVHMMMGMTENELRNKISTASNTRYWCANIKLTMANKPSMSSLGMVFLPTATMTEDSNSYYVRFNCETPGAVILYNHNYVTPSYTPTCEYDGNVVEIPKSWFPDGTVTMTCRAVKDGWTDAGVVTLKLQSTGVESASVPAAGIKLNKTSLTLTPGASETLTATVTPENSTDTVTWNTSDAGIVSVNSTGKVTALREGTAAITATAGSKTESCIVTVSAAAVAMTGVSLNKTVLNLAAGASETLIASVLPQNATITSITWTSSNSSIASVSGNGKVTAVKEGSAVITAEAGGKTAACAVTVSAAAVPVAGVSLNKSTLNLAVGSSEILTASVLPDNAANTSVNWSSSDSSIAIVDGTGLVTAVSPGSAVITVSTADGNKTATCIVNVSSSTVPVTEISLNKTTLNLSVGASESLTASVSPKNATNASVTWESSAASVASVSNGKVTALSPGTTAITASAGGKKAVCNVTVTEAAPSVISVTSVNLNKTTLNLTVGKSETLAAYVLPEDATNTSVTWISSDNSVATVNRNGRVTAVREGSAVITVSTADGGKESSCIVNVTSVSVPVTGIRLGKTTLSLTVGASELLTASVMPENATNADITWGSSVPSVAAVASGKVTAVREGTAIITASAGGFTSACTVTVTPATHEDAVAVESILLNKNKLELTVGASEALSVTVTPESAAEGAKVSWISSAPAVAVAVNGRVTAVSPGTAVITASAGGKTASCTVTVASAAAAPSETQQPEDNPQPEDDTDLTVPDFEDVAESAWYNEYVDFVMRKGLFDPTDENHFSPEAPMTRAMLATALHRMAKAPEPDVAAPFTDVAKDAAYADAVAWCFQTGVVNGMSAEIFAPDESITREQITAMFCRYASKVAEADMMAFDDLSAFTDRDSISGWALAEMQWAVGAGLILGMTSTTIVPQGTTTRAQCAALVQRLANYIA